MTNSLLPNTSQGPPTRSTPPPNNPWLRATRKIKIYDSLLDASTENYRNPRLEHSIMPVGRVPRFRKCPNPRGDVRVIAPKTGPLPRRTNGVAAPRRICWLSLRGAAGPTDGSGQGSGRERYISGLELSKG
uniref:Uncharacterized protein n=1 Tax=Steinernema glaseri TaxID=37863 RepID=A0A1I7YEQ2_9BILA